MRFVVGYYLTQAAMQERKEPRRSVASRRQQVARLPLTKWLAVLRPRPAAQRAHTAQVSRSA
jgi:hypothetical protein